MQARGIKLLIFWLWLMGCVGSHGANYDNRFTTNADSVSINGNTLTNLYVTHVNVFTSNGKASPGAVTFFPIIGGATGTLAASDTGCLGVGGTLTNFTYRLLGATAPLLSTTNLTFRFYTNQTVVAGYNFTINGGTATGYATKDTSGSWFNSDMTNTVVIGLSNSAANATGNFSLVVGFDVVR